MLIFIGVQLVTFGLLAEVMARTYYESQDKPTYVIREVRETADLEALAAASAERTQRILGADDRAPAARARSAHHRHPAGAVQREPLEGRQVPRAVRRQAGPWRAARVRSGDDARQLGAGRARPGAAIADVSVDPRIGGPQRRVRRERHAAASAQDSHRRQRRDRRSLLPRCQGHRQQRHHDRQRRVRRPQHHPQLQERRHRDRGPRQHRLQLRSLFGVEGPRRQGHPDGRLHLPRRRRSSVRSDRYSGAAAGPHRPRHRGRRRHLARHARGGDRWIDHRPRCHHWSRRGRRRRDSRVFDRHGHSGEGHAGSPRPWSRAAGVQARICAESLASSSRT